jgi:hypothetical protein
MTDFIHAHINAPSSIALRAFPEYADQMMEDAVRDITDSGADFMHGIVPRGENHNLAQAIDTIGPVKSNNRIHGSVLVNPFVAPYADLVDRGTGIDGPFRQGVILTRPSKTKPGKPGVMSFQKNAEDPRARRAVKVSPSLKIQRGKNFSGRTYDHMQLKTKERVEFIVRSSIPGYFRATGAR